MKRIVTVLVVALAAALTLPLPAQAQNAPQALYSRTTKAVGFVMSRAPERDVVGNCWWNVSGWQDFQTGELVDDTTIVYRRHSGEYSGHGCATIELQNVQLVNLGNFEWGTPVVERSDLQERRLTTVTVAAGQEYEETFTANWSKTTNLEEAAKVGLEIAVKASVGYVPGNATGGVTGSFELSAKASAEYSRRWGASETTATTSTRRFKITGPFKGYVLQSRSIDKVTRSIEAPPTFEHRISLKSGGQEIYAWSSWEQLLQVLEGYAPTNRSLSPKFYNNPISTAELRAINVYRLPKIRWTATYDDVTHQTIEMVEEVDLDGDGDTDTTKRYQGERVGSQP